MAGWSLVSTIKAPETQVLAFVAHHLTLGADHLWLYFDDPQSPVPAQLALHPQVTSFVCDETYWEGRGTRPEKLEVRQSWNARDAYGRCKSDWLTHIDVDEFICADRPVARILEDVPAEALVVQLEPFEAMHDPTLPDDIFTARQFRAPLRSVHAALRPLALGGFATLFPQGMLSHSAGKAFFRSGIRGLKPRIHAAVLNGKRVPADGRHPEMRLLHFHAQDPAAWRAALPFRLVHGAYQFQPDLQAFLQAASDAVLDDFYKATQTLSAEALAALASAQRLWTADLHLRRTMKTVFGEP